MEETNILMSMDSQGAHITSSAVAEKLAKKNLSASLITGLEGCHVRWLGDTFVVRDLVEAEPDNAGRRGSLFHKVMENLFALPPEERTKTAMKHMVKTTIEEPEFADLAQNADVIAWLRNAINGYYNMGGDPTKVTIAEIVRDGKAKSGIEFFVKGTIGKSSRPVLGFIDQMILDPTRDDGSIIIQDWKSGAKAKKYKAKNKSQDGFPEQRQQIIYSELVRQLEIKVSGARLIFPVPRVVVDVDLGSTELRDKVIHDVEEADKKLDVIIETNDFEYKPGFLCAWCPLVSICPVGTVKPYDKMIAAAASQPSPEVLLKGIELL